MRQNPGGDDRGVRSEVGSVLPPPPPGLVAAAAAQQSGRAWPQPTIIPQSAPSMVSSVENPANVDGTTRFYLTNL